jgi:hypothetical protein
MAYTYSKISTYTVGSGGVPSVTFLNIPQNYTDLIIKASPRNNRDAGVWSEMSFNVNGSTSNYSSRYIEGGDSTAVSGTGVSTKIGLNSTGLLYTATFGSTEIYIPNYTGSNYKTFSIETVNEGNQAGGVYQSLWAGLWSDTSPITSITFTAVAGATNFVQYSSFHLYGIKAEL